MSTSLSQPSIDEETDRLARALHRRPRPGPVFDRWYASYLRAGRVAELETWVRALADSEKEDSSLLAWASLVSERQGMGDLASEMWRRAYALDPGDPWIEGRYGWILAHARDPSAVSVLLGVLPRLSPRGLQETWDLILSSGSLFRTEDYGRLLDELESVVGSDFDALMTLAEDCENVGDSNRAERLWERVVVEDDDAGRRTEALLSKASSLSRRGEPLQAIDVYLDVLDRVDTTDWIGQRVYGALGALRDRGEGGRPLIERLKQRARAQPQEWPTGLFLARTQWLEGECELALGRLEALLAPRPEEVSLRRQRIQWLCSLDRFDDAYEELRSLEMMEPGEADSLLELTRFAARWAGAQRPSWTRAALRIGRRSWRGREGDPRLALSLADVFRNATLEEIPAFIEEALFFHRTAVVHGRDEVHYLERLMEACHALGRDRELRVHLRTFGVLEDDWLRVAEWCDRFSLAEECSLALQKSVETLARDSHRVVVWSKLMLKVAPQKNLDRSVLGAVENRMSLDQIEEMATIRLDAWRRTDRVRDRLEDLSSLDGRSLCDSWTLARGLEAQARHEEALGVLDDLDPATWQQSQGRFEAAIGEARARLLTRVGRDLEAIALYQSLLEEEPRGSLELWESLLTSLIKVEDIEGLKEAVTELVERMPRSPRSHVLAARSLASVGEPQGAIEMLRRGLTGAFAGALESGVVHEELAEHLSRSGEQEEAVAHLLLALANEETREARTRIIRRLASWEGRQVYRVLSSSSAGTEEEHRRDVLDAAIALSDDERLELELERWDKRGDSDLSILRLRARLAYEGERWAEVRSLLESVRARGSSAMTKESRSAEESQWLAIAYRHLGEPERAAEAWGEIPRVMFSSTTFLDEVRAVLREGEFEGALALCHSALGVLGSSWAVSYYQALASIGTGRSATASAMAALKDSRPLRGDRTTAIPASPFDYLEGGLEKATIRFVDNAFYLSQAGTDERIGDWAALVERIFHPRVHREIAVHRVLDRGDLSDVLNAFVEFLEGPVPQPRWEDRLHFPLETPYVDRLGIQWMHVIFGRAKAEGRVDWLLGCLERELRQRPGVSLRLATAFFLWECGDVRGTHRLLQEAISLGPEPVRLAIVAVSAKAQRREYVGALELLADHSSPAEAWRQAAVSMVRRAFGSSDLKDLVAGIGFVAIHGDFEQELEEVFEPGHEGIRENRPSVSSRGFPTLEPGHDLPELVGIATQRGLFDSWREEIFSQRAKSHRLAAIAFWIEQEEEDLGRGAQALEAWMTSIPQAGHFYEKWWMASSLGGDSSLKGFFHAAIRKALRAACEVEHADWRTRTVQTWVDALEGAKEETVSEALAYIDEQIDGCEQFATANRIPDKITFFVLSLFESEGSVGSALIPMMKRVDQRKASIHFPIRFSRELASLLHRCRDTLSREERSRAAAMVVSWLHERPQWRDSWELLEVTMSFAGEERALAEGPTSWIDLKSEEESEPLPSAKRDRTRRQLIAAHLLQEWEQVLKTARSLPEGAPSPRDWLRISEAHWRVGDKDAAREAFEYAEQRRLSRRCALTDTMFQRVASLVLRDPSKSRSG